MVPHSWILKCLKALGMDESIKKMLENSIKKWSIELFCGSESQGDVEIKRGILQEDFFVTTALCCMFNTTDICVKEMHSRL